MYAIIRSGGKQSKVQEGDVIDIERLKGVAVDGEVTFTPLLLVNEDGSVVADADSLGKASVTAKVLGEHRGEKVHVFKYKNKTGYRRTQGHRQTYTTIEVTGITETLSIAGPQQQVPSTRLEKVSVVSSAVLCAAGTLQLFRCNPLYVYRVILLGCSMMQRFIYADIGIF